MIKQKINKLFNKNKKLEFLIRSQFWKTSELESYQNKKLVELVNYAYQNVEYYKKLFLENNINPNDIKTIKDLKRIPILKKDDIRKNFNSLLSKKSNKSELILNSTGGSTGIPVKIYQDKNYNEWAEAARIRSWKVFLGMQQNEREAVLWGDIRDVGKKFSIKNILKYYLLNTIEINTFDLDIKKIKSFISQYNKKKPKIIRGYAASLYFISDWIIKNQVNVSKPVCIISSAEKLTQKMRNCIEMAFNSKVFDSYGSRELSQIASECERHNGYHIVAENQIVELIEDNDQYSSEFKKIIVTNLNNFAMPLIRYEVGDLADSINYEKCECGRTLPRINKILGRENENIFLKNNKIINGEYFEFLFYEIHEVVQYQVKYSKFYDRLTFTISMKDQTNLNQITSFLKKTIFNHFGIKNIDIKISDNFEKSPSGKFKFVWMEDL